MHVPLDLAIYELSSWLTPWFVRIIKLADPMVCGLCGLCGLRYPVGSSAGVFLG